MDKYLSRTGASRELYQRAQRVLPMGVSYNIRYFEPYPFYVARAQGGRVWDLDGNEYLDFWVGHGALLLGHCHPATVQAMKEQVELGAHLGFAHPWEVEHAEQIVKMVPSAQMVRFTNSGTEANLLATRLARAYTGRVKMGKFEGGWHGSYDPLHVGVSWPLDTPDSAGLSPGSVADTVVLPFNDLEGTAQVVKKGELAAVVVEPVQGGAGCIPAEKGFLAGLRQVCHDSGTLLIFDEVITGFRLAPGGGQEFYGVIPDLTVLGKVVGGGSLPAGAVAGRAGILELVDARQHPEKQGRVFHGGTYTANPLVARAGLAALRELDVNRERIYPHLNRLGEGAREGLRRLFQDHGVTAHATGVGSLVGIHFTREKPRDIRGANQTRDPRLTEAYFRYALERGIIFIGPRLVHLLLCAAHSQGDIDHLLAVTEDFLHSWGGAA